MRACLVALALALGVAIPAFAQDDAQLLVVLPEGTRGELVDALRVELRGRGARATFVLAPAMPESDEAALVLARANGCDAVLWVAMGESPLAPPDARYATSASPSARAARLPAAADVIAPRMFALTMSELLDAPPELDVPQVAPSEAASIAMDEPAPVAPPAPAHEERPQEASAAAEPAGAPPRIFHPQFSPRLALGIGAVEASEPFFVAAALDLGVTLTPWLLFVGDLTAWYQPGPDRFGGWLAIGLAGRAESASGDLILGLEGGAAVFADRLGVGGGLVARWDFSVDDLRIGPRIAGDVWKTVVSLDASGPDIGWQLFAGLDVGFDARLF